MIHTLKRKYWKYRNSPTYPVLFLTNLAISTIRLSILTLAIFPWSRQILNFIYLKLTASQRSAYHSLFAKIFRDVHVRGRNGFWKVTFLNKTILMPLFSDTFWLDWDTALSINGHEMEIKQTYENLIASPLNRPSLFVDVGANYGTHSLLFLINNIETISFEPHSSCHDIFRRMCELNHVSPRIEPVALGNNEGFVELLYPERDTWLGSTNQENITQLKQSCQLITKKVKQKAMDSYIHLIKDKQCLIKIDTEGNELAVLQGAEKTLAECKPMLIFESWKNDERITIFDFLNQRGYSIYHLPWPTQQAKPLDVGTFINSWSSNFIAIAAPGTARRLEIR